MASLEFHERFKQPSTAPIFQSNDDMCFRFEWLPLEVASSFFRNLRTIPQPSNKTDETKLEIYELPSATAFAMQFAFTALDNTLKGIAPPVLSKPFSTDQLDEILTFANAYDMPLVTRCLYRGVKASPDVLLGLAVAAGETKIGAELSLKLLGMSPKDISSWALTKLEMHHPDVLLTLADNQYHFSRALWECCNGLMRETRCKFLIHHQEYIDEESCFYYQSLNELFTAIQAKPLLLLALEESECPHGPWNTVCLNDNWPKVCEHIAKVIPLSAYSLNLLK